MIATAVLLIIICILSLLLLLSFLLSFKFLNSRCAESATQTQVPRTLEMKKSKRRAKEGGGKNGKRGVHGEEERAARHCWACWFTLPWSSNTWGMVNVSLWWVVWSSGPSQAQAI